MLEYFIEIWQILLTAQLPLTFIAELLTMLMCNLKTSKNIFLLSVTFSKEWKQT